MVLRLYLIWDIFVVFLIIILVVLFGFKQYNWTSTFHRTFLAFAFVFILKFNLYSII